MRKCDKKNDAKIEKEKTFLKINDCDVSKLSLNVSRLAS